MTKRQRATGVPPRAGLVALTLTAMLALAGCGGDDGGGVRSEGNASASGGGSASGTGSGSATGLANQDLSGTTDDPAVLKAIADYKTWAVAEVEALVGDTKKFTDAVRANDLAKAKAEFAPSRVRWERIERPAPAAGARTYEIVLVPWPLAVGAHDFRPASAELLENMDAGVFGFFEFAPEGTLDCGFVDGLLRSARARTGAVDAVVLPEAAVMAAELPALEEVLARHGATFLFAAVELILVVDIRTCCRADA